MALITCKKCGQQMSDKAQVCPHCGAIVRKSSSVVLPLILGIVVYGVLSAILNFLLFMIADSTYDQPFCRWIWYFISYPFYTSSCTISAVVVSMFIAKSKTDRLICLIVPIAIYGIYKGIVWGLNGILLYEYRNIISLLATLIGLGVVIFAAVRRKKHNKVA